MEDRITKSGIEIIGDVPWGTHFCMFYHSRNDLEDILIPYFRAGLENNELCMWVTSRPMEDDFHESHIERINIEFSDIYSLN